MYIQRPFTDRNKTNTYVMFTRIISTRVLVERYFRNKIKYLCIYVN